MSTRPSSRKTTPEYLARWLANGRRSESSALGERLDHQIMGGAFMKSLIFKRSIMVAGRKTSVSLEDEFWNGLKEIACERHMRLSELVAEIDAQRQLGNLSSAPSAFRARILSHPTFAWKGGTRRNSRSDQLHRAHFFLRLLGAPTYQETV
jgi:predicted DNA-binding ribbon-helix-helix protein